MPLAQITITEGRSPEMVDQMAEAVTKAIAATLGVRRQNVRVAINEIPTAHWYVAGESITHRSSKNAGVDDSNK